MILDRIIAQKKIEVEKNRKKSRSLAASLRKPGEVALIAEIKKASPSKGLIREDFDPGEIARIYSTSGASAISVLTDKEFFQGSPEYLSTARSVSKLPLLRKDFIIDPYQIYEARLLGADAILLIMAVLTDREAGEFQGIAAGLGMDCLVEVHTADELKRALALDAQIIGINNRNLQTFKTELETTFRLREMISDPNITVVSESGINTRDDVLKLKEHDVHAMLVGEALMRESDIAKKVAELLGR
ncbi:MAG: indole-3-glycerol phosphate synthase TrpC [Firmicutes bacterium HGW-Firmicutes-8]|nr:MAG: indole-3-glycerol phosphate synthase TrpC [Firmicutes bacterium HGW-Firmicutes-8]